MGTKPPRGWYDNPEHPGQERWWDGETWTERVRPKSQTPAPPPQAADSIPSRGWWSRRSMFSKIAIVVAGSFFGLALLGGLLPDVEEPESTAAAAADAEGPQSTPVAAGASSETESEEQVQVEREAPEPDPEQEEEAPNLTRSQENALRSAEQYLNMTSFSRSGLIEQLEFEGYSTEDATFAVDAVEVDWKEQAARSAEQYLNMTSFSRPGLIEQLEFEGFTREQAEYGVDQTGL